jgi:hypothetical protein
VPAAVVRPAQLPADIAAFAGRAAQLRDLDALMHPHGGRATVVIAAIDGAMAFVRPGRHPPSTPPTAAARPWRICIST